VRDEFDLLVIGGGVNGCGVAVDAAGRGLSVALCEMSDLASATSSRSSKLIHGGLRYLEYYEFRLVRKALKEREVLLAKAPHIIWPLRFRMPHMPHLRPAWMIRLGLFLYDNMARRVTLPGAKSIKFGPDSPLVTRITKGFEYSDCWVDDARLVALNAMQAQDKGAEIFTRTKCVAIARENAFWRITLEDMHSGQRRDIRAKAMVNAAGPWVQSLFEEELKEASPRKIRLVKGSHIIVPKLYKGEHCYILQNEDKRIVFAIPYEGQFTLIGTTDVEITGNPADVKIDQGEKEYLVKLINGYFKHKISIEDIVHSYSGVRALLDDEKDDPSAVTRDYVLVKNGGGEEPAIVSVFGGKITTYRVLGEAVMDKLKDVFPDMPGSWTGDAPLPGGDFDTPDALLSDLKTTYPWLPSDVARRYVRSYGTLCREFLKNAHGWQDMGEDFGHGLTAREVDYLCDREWAETAEDILWRRSKLGLFVEQDGVKRLHAHLHARQP
jgi:glycerol-3-phosphate dehydrogenase